jgi:hypothetical protein
MRRWKESSLNQYCSHRAFGNQFSKNSLIRYGYLFLSATLAARLDTVRQAGVSDDGSLGFRYTLRLPAKACSPPSWSWPGLQSYISTGRPPMFASPGPSTYNSTPSPECSVIQEFKPSFWKKLLRSDLSTGATLVIISFS